MDIWGERSHGGGNFKFKDLERLSYGYEELRVANSELQRQRQQRSTSDKVLDHGKDLLTDENCGRF